MVPVRYGRKTYPKHPGKTAYGRRQVGDDASLDSTHVGRESRAAIETKPAKPEEYRAKDDVCSVVRLVCESFSTISPALTEIDGNGKSGCTGGDVNGSSSGEVEAAH